MGLLKAIQWSCSRSLEVERLAITAFETVRIFVRAPGSVVSGHARYGRFGTYNPDRDSPVSSAVCVPDLTQFVDCFKFAFSSVFSYIQSMFSAESLLVALMTYKTPLLRGYKYLS